MCASFSDGGVEEEQESMGNLGWDRSWILFGIDEGMTGVKGSMDVCYVERWCCGNERAFCLFHSLITPSQAFSSFLPWSHIHTHSLVNSSPSPYKITS